MHYLFPRSPPRASGPGSNVRLLAEGAAGGACLGLDSRPGCGPAESLGDFHGGTSCVLGCEAAGEPRTPEELCTVATPWPQALCEDCC